MAYNDLVRVPFSGTNAITPLILDIGALQQLYGVKDDPNNSGSNTYRFVSTITELDNGQFTIYQGQIKAIWDAGGAQDTFDASALATDSTIDLRPGRFSTIGQNSLVSKDNISIAFNPPDARYQNNYIENAIGGSGNDVLIGNAGANELRGGSGNDSLDGGTSANPGDTEKGKGDGQSVRLIGGLGIDTYILRTGGGTELILDDGINWIQL